MRVVKRDGVADEWIPSGTVVLPNLPSVSGGWERRSERSTSAPRVRVSSSPPVGRAKSWAYSVFAGRSESDPRATWAATCGAGCRARRRSRAMNRRYMVTRRKSASSTLKILLLHCAVNPVVTGQTEEARDPARRDERAGRLTLQRSLLPFRSRLGRRVRLGGAHCVLLDLAGEGFQVGRGKGERVAVGWGCAAGADSSRGKEQYALFDTAFAPT